MQRQMARGIHCVQVFSAAFAALMSCDVRSVPIASTKTGIAAADVLAGTVGSRVASDAQQGDLLYVSSDATDKTGSEYVYVYSYPSGQLKGKLTGFGTPEGLCVDGFGDVFVPDNVYSEVYEYAHGTAKPKAILQDEQNGQPVDCSVDPVTGNLAVANFGDVAIFSNASGRPTIYSDADIFEVFACGYDDAGDLYVDGADHSLNFLVAELSKGSTAFSIITLHKLPHTIYLSDGVKWDGKYLAVDDLDRSTIYQVEVRGSVGTVVGSTILTDGYSTGAFWFPNLRPGSGQEAKKIIGTKAYTGVNYWNYPAGGASTKALSVGDPLGVALSPGSK
jgi:hypothetical protein